MGQSPFPAWGKRRMHHIFGDDGKAVAVAMDGSRRGPAPGLQDPSRVVSQVVAGGADAILTTIGFARAAQSALGHTGLILALDSEGPIADYGVEQAVRYGADAVELKVFPGSETDSKLADLRRLAARCAEWGMPLLAEPIPVSFAEPAAHTFDNVAKAARTAAEAGADLVKVHYIPDDQRDYAQITATCYVPLLILGGPAKQDPREALAAAAAALDAGASGIVYGRNIVQHPRPDRMVAALRELVHGGASLDVATKVLSVPR